MLLCVSGGSDSIALMYGMHEIQEALGLERTGVAHVNHGLRGKESDDDESFVKGQAEFLGIPFFSCTLHGKSMNDPGVEEWARDERYRFFFEIAAKEQFELIATGHTADDQAETVVLRLLRGAGIKGLRGILPLREDGVIRPLLDLHRAEILEWLRIRNIGFRTDASNNDNRYKRNWIRNVVLPSLTAQEPSAADNIIQCAVQARNAWEIIRKAVNKWLDGYVIKQECSFTISKVGFEDWVTAAEALHVLFEKYGIGIQRYHIEHLRENVRRSNGTILLPGNWCYYLSRHEILFSPHTGPESFSYEISVPGETVCGPLNKTFRVTEVDAMTADKIDGMTAYFALEGEEKLVYRSSSANDRFRPFGYDADIALMEFLKKQGLPKAFRERTGIVATNKGEVVWVPGFRISEQFKIRDNSKRIFMVSCGLFS